MASGTYEMILQLGQAERRNDHEKGEIVAMEVAKSQVSALPSGSGKLPLSLAILRSRAPTLVLGPLPLMARLMGSEVRLINGE